MGGSGMKRARTTMITMIESTRFPDILLSSMGHRLSIVILPSSS
jgi:hypothetical protein